MKLKRDIDIVRFLNQVKACSGDVWADTGEDRINLKSVLCQYTFVVMSSRKGLLDRIEIECSEPDREVLVDYMER